MQDRIFHAGTFIFRSGDPSGHAFLIREGTVDLLRDATDAASRYARLGTGEVFGEMSLIEERPHSSTAWALTKVTATVLTRDEFETMLTTDPTNFRLYLKALFERLRTLSAHAEIPMAEPVQSDDTTSAPDILTAATAPVSVVIIPLTRRAAATLPDDGLTIPKFPFRIGRASEDREPQSMDLNDWWLLDSVPFHISRNHCAIELHNDAVIIKDRGSSRGIHVNEMHIGGSSPKRQAVLEEGDNVVLLGGKFTPYQFRIHVARV